ncbi:hypothetical protein [Massilia sp. NR 4-1]|uniref:hypothetical protein n=1 Tax=Massilia sp. NR 4-1 TaxID=1678028 RepID=UPI00067BF897|nr:hypothetical protein [Massilia sp. NR 4-1]AKU21231.1 hypothetical protein ACZ75_06810 [Massilia sp. NR 4-1]
MNNPYAEALVWIQRNPGTGSSSSLAKAVLSLYNSLCGYSIAECIGNLDRGLTILVLRMVSDYATNGETQALRDVGEVLSNKLYPRLWEMGIAMHDARQNCQERWRADELKAEREALDAAEAALFTDNAKLIPASKAKELLEQGDIQYAYVHTHGDWRSTKLSREKVVAAIEAMSGTELSSNCPESSKMLAVCIEQRIYYVCTDYDAREAYLDTIRPSHNEPPRYPMFSLNK